MTWMIVALVVLALISLAQFIWIGLIEDRLGKAVQVIEGLKDCNRKQTQWLDLADEDLNRTMDRAAEALKIAKETKDHVDSRVAQN